MRNKKVAASAVGALLLSGGLAFATTAPAWADDEVCVPSEGSTTTETTDWLTEAPEGNGWEVVDEQTVIDREAEYGTEYLVAFYQQTDWLTEAPEGEGWKVIATREHEAEGYFEHQYSREVMTDPGSPEVPEVSHTDKEFKRWVVTQEAQPAEYRTLYKYVKIGWVGEVWLPDNSEARVKIDGWWYQRTSKTKQEKIKDEVPEQGE